MAAKGHYFNRKLHSLLGVIPLGVFLLQHLFVNHYILYGTESFNRAAQFMENLPLRYFLEAFFIFIPLLYHGVYGLYIAYQAKPNVLNYGFFRNVMFLLQRVTGVILIIFIAWHVWETRVAAAFGAEVNAQMMIDILSSPFMVAFYIIGVVSAAFHFANGMWSFCVTWGITVGPKAQRISTYVWMVVFVILAIGGSLIVFEFASLS
ncbi:succinate dehydrogenase cytochrome b558 subunit [Caldalkalibacillus thermarum]|uniref:succinate dehydrogenase cytochrome b558 subunit n=1 Tax=Caldalkalibacillus thermarum TaxID=296745 RepID=UPI00166A0A8F|nr:succinate dehydrogenase cytochrome b558 subunit [Caldalkalibacillus thermarum]GGK32893.1 succinate dehydrogenase cytochrome b558 subunit [Caldalkalibacillus thermarum]